MRFIVRLLMFFYHAAWTGIFPLIFSLAYFFKQNRLRSRMGFFIPESSIGKPVIWIHALSVGEVFSVLPLIQNILERFTEYKIAFSVTTEKGMEAAAKELSEQKNISLLWMPFDCWIIMKRLINYINPELFILVESDIWPGLLDILNRKRIPSLFVNGRISSKTFKRYSYFPLFPKIMFTFFNSCMMQSKLDTKRMLYFIPDSAKVITSGNMKFDRIIERAEDVETSYWLNLLGLTVNSEIIVAGSTHPGEEEIIFEVFNRLKLLFNNLILIIAPRDIKRKKEVSSLAEDMGLKAVLRTSILKGSKVSSNVIILDTIGELSSIYILASVAFVGGSLVSEGGHNMLEPAVFGCPVLFGPYVNDFMEIAERIQDAGGGFIVNNAEDLYFRLKKFIEDKDAGLAVKQELLNFLKENSGAVELISSKLYNMLVLKNLNFNKFAQ